MLHILTVLFGAILGYNFRKFILASISIILAVAIAFSAWDLITKNSHSLADVIPMLIIMVSAELLLSMWIARWVKEVKQKRPGWSLWKMLKESTLDTEK